jgi:outer membrane protein TolC
VPLALGTSTRAQENGAPPPALPIATVSPDFVSEPEVSIDELIARALQNSPQLPLGRENLEAARQRAGAARGLLNPTLQAVPRLAGNSEAADTEIIVSQPLDLFGRRRAQARVLSAQVRGAEADNLLAQRTLIVQVKNAATDLFAAQEAENLGVSQVEVARLFRDAAARRAQLGDVPAVQAQRAGLELLRTQNELTSARAERLVRRAALNGIIGQAPETPLRVVLPISTDFAVVLPPTIELPTAQAGDISTPATPVLGASSQIGSDLVAQREALLPGALQRPDIVSTQAAIEAREAQVRAIARGRYPEVELQLRRGSFFGEGASSTALRAVVTVPLFDFGSLGREKKAAQSEVRAGQSQLALLRQQAATQVEQALIRLEQQRRTAETYRTGIVPQTLDLLRKTQIGYAQGASTYLEVLEAQRTLRAVQTEYLQALVGTRTSEAALESALGATPPANGSGPLSNPVGSPTLPGTAAPGTVPEGTIPPNPSEPLNPPSANLPGTNAPLGQGAMRNLETQDR